MAGLSVGAYFSAGKLPVLPSSRDPADDDGRYWLHMTPDGTAVLLNPVHDLGQDTPASFAQIVAKELNLKAEEIRLVMPGTSEIPYMRFTTGSHGMSSHARPVARAAAVMRKILRRKAADSLGAAPAEVYDMVDGFRIGTREIRYADLVDGKIRTIAAEDFGDVPLYSFFSRWPKNEIGRNTRDNRDIEIVTGAELFVDDFSLSGMLYGRMLQPPFPGARLRGIDLDEARDVAGVVDVFHDAAEAMVGVVAATPSALEQAMAKVRVTWDEPHPLDDAGLATLVDVDAFLLKGALEHVIEDEELAADED